MTDNDLIRRIESLNRRPLKNKPEPGEAVSGFPERMEASSLYRGRSGRSSNPETPGDGVSGLERSGSPETSHEPPVLKLEETIAGVVTEPRPGCCYYHIECQADLPEVCADIIHGRFVHLTGHPHSAPIAPLAEGFSLESLDPTKVVFMDIETTGLRGCPLFLIGAMRSDGEKFIFKQYFARDYCEESGVIAAFAEDLRDVDLLVTFNGLRFDMPFIVGRGSHHGIRVHCHGAHLDLLLAARKHYRKETPNHKLQTLERVICGREREGDIPGSQIPQAYDDYVFSGDASRITTILHHNRLDLLTLPELMTRMWREE